MKAIVHTQYGPPEVAHLKEVATPVPVKNEVLIKIHASTVNRTDCGFRSAEYFISRFFSGLFRPNQQILGCEFSGIIEAIGPEVKTFEVGDAVFGLDDAKFGGHAEYKVIAENRAIATIPEGVSFQQAAAISEGAHYAWVDIRAAKIKKGQNILVNGATGAIGSAAVQLIKYLGANVTAVCDTKNVSLVKSLGADVVIDYKKEDFTQLQDKFDVVFDAVGKSSFGKCKPLLKKNGIYISTEFGKMAQNPFLAIITPMLGGKKVLFPIPATTKSDIEFLKMLVANRHYKPVIDRSYPLDDVVNAYRYVETGQKTGNVIIEVVKGI